MFIVIDKMLVLLLYYNFWQRVDLIVNNCYSLITFSKLAFLYTLFFCCKSLVPQVLLNE